MVSRYESLAVSLRPGHAGQPGGVRFAVRVKPRSSRNSLGGVREGALELSVTAPPVDGEANEAVVRALAEALSVGRREVTIVTGDTGRQKVIEIAGLGPDELRLRLDACAGGRRS
jgi:uncharacterized protein